MPCPGVVPCQGSRHHPYRSISQTRPIASIHTTHFVAQQLNQVDSASTKPENDPQPAEPSDVFFYLVCPPSFSHRRGYLANVAQGIVKKRSDMKRGKGQTPWVPGGHSFARQ
ncbi:hypothetical protein V2G26_006471 [Clonostachys chloroleuca]